MVLTGSQAPFFHLLPPAGYYWSTEHMFLSLLLVRKVKFPTLCRKSQPACYSFSCKVSEAMRIIVFNRFRHLRFNLHISDVLRFQSASFIWRNHLHLQLMKLQRFHIGTTCPPKPQAWHTIVTLEKWSKYRLISVPLNAHSSGWRNSS